MNPNNSRWECKIEKLTFIITALLQQELLFVSGA